ncbi:hypothetical protein [Melittangium boletus]|uniref:Lipoprotein n=1 Tax=Melittangium boletus DSM 14713 TaxID=1294270 RepID=A0A250II96_9BACT|nr:hypothetical protein [Melittangium boletus]ATB30940.1 hypothetical protein MEBOL_004402 [Melittangium boletus DSM 14713]
MMNRIFGRITVMGILALGVGCGGTVLEEDVEGQSLDSVVQAAQQETPRKVEDLIGALDRQAGVLHVVEGSQAIVLKELKAERIDNNTYMTRDELTGEQWRYSIVPYPGVLWPKWFKLCPNGQLVFTSMECPTRIVDDPLVRVWQNSSCGFRVQAASTGACVNASSGSYRYEYLLAYKCGVGTGFCVERPAAMAIRYDYILNACDPSLISNVQSENHNYLCKR